MTKKILIDEAVVKEALYRLNGWAEGCGYNADEAVCAQLREALEANNEVVNATEPDYTICPACGGMAADPIVPVETRQQEPEGVVIEGYEDRIIHWRDGFMPSVGTKLYRSPPASKPLTDDELRNVLRNTNHMIRNAMHGPFWPELEQACRAIEAVHGITSNQGD